MGRGALPAVGGAEIMMLGRMRVAGEADREAPPFEQREERVAIGQVRIGFGVEKVAQRDVHHEDDQLVARRVREDVAHEFELGGVDAALIFARPAGLC